MQPLYDENIIVYVLHGNKGQWYVTDKAIWIMDMQKYSQTMNHNGYETSEQPDDLRKDLEVLNEATCDEFIRRIDRYKVSKDELYEQIINRFEAIVARSKKSDQPYHISFSAEVENKDQPDDILDYVPVLFVDFDKMILLSQYPEAASYERYVPNGWEGEYASFDHLIPEQIIYWLDMSGHSVFDEINPLRELFYWMPCRKE